MARNSNNRSNDGNNRVSGKVRFIMLETEIYEGNLSEITQAIANAVRPAPIIQQVIQSPQSPAALLTADNKNDHTNGSGQNGRQTVMDVPDHEDADEVHVAPPAPKRQPTERKPFQGKVMHLDWDSGEMPFLKFVAEKKPKTNIARYLTVSAWFKQYRNLDIINANHVYNAYLKAKWKLLFDMGATFRKGAEKDKRYFELKSNGHYSITTYGLDEVVKLSGEETAEES